MVYDVDPLESDADHPARNRDFGKSWTGTFL